MGAWVVSCLLFVCTLAVRVFDLFTGTASFSLLGHGVGVSPFTVAAPEVRGKIVAKLDEPLFYADIRAYVSAGEQQDVARRMSGITSAFATFDTPGYQSLAPDDRLVMHRGCARYSWASPLAFSRHSP